METFMAPIKLYWTVLVLSVMIIALHATGSREVKYIGCLKQTSGSQSFTIPAFEELPWGFSKMDVTRCVKECWRKRFKLAGLKGGKTCLCSTSTKDMIKQPDSACNKKCNGNCYQLCGGATALSVYQTGYFREPTFELDINALQGAKIGCYRRYESRGILCPPVFAPLITQRMSPALCIFYCDALYQTQFSTTAGKDKCCCTNSVTGALSTIMSQCDAPCYENQEVACYGYRYGGATVATFQTSRLPKFKKWPKSVFQEATWLEPQFPPGKKFETQKKETLSENVESGLIPPKIISEPNSIVFSATLEKKISEPDKSSLISATKMARDSQEPQPLLADMDRKEMSELGEDNREPKQEGLENSVAVVEIPVKKAYRKPPEDKGNEAIITAVIVGFVVFTAAFGIYLFRNNSMVSPASDDQRVKKFRRKKKRRKKMPKDNEDETNLI